MSNKSWMEGKDRPQDDPVPEQVRPQRGKKNTRKWCRGKEGREHHPETVRHHFYDGPLFKDKDCHWVTHYVYRNGEAIKVRDVRWSCYHVIRCSECGKHLDTFLDKEQCPTFQAQEVTE